MTDDDLLAWYHTQPLHYALDGILHDLREPFEPFGTMALLVRQFSHDAQACLSFAESFRHAVETIIEHPLNDDLWAIRQAIASQLPKPHADEPNQPPVRTWDRPPDVVETQRAQQLRTTMSTIQHTIQSQQDACLTCLPDDLQVQLASMLEQRFAMFLRRLALLEQIIVPRIRAEVCEGT